jgi:hypothetical protein
VETGNPSACETVKCKVCKSAIAGYCLYVCGIRCECVNQMLINPIIRTRTSLISGVCHPTRHNILFSFLVFSICDTCPAHFIFLGLIILTFGEHKL